MTMSTTTATHLPAHREPRVSISARLYGWMQAYGRHRALRWLDQQPDDFLESCGLDRKTMEENIRSM